ncbi:MAG: DUF89 domain of unknown function [uncultured Sulfurovum sp.]|uniref:Damage-control phosphatase ARMT1-like metal-binding domain-containing protein n=1 Tax=uncultured Sulfurovum sp. TaxID=269237 RepID=A0A6S6TPY2_9BACT|nr:MAG: DUF89 domain of unknown function [uncultured Sulfurovum sp.]
MNLKSECLSCLLNQSLRVAKNLNLDEQTSKKMMTLAATSIGAYGEISPPVAASDLYPKLASFTENEDVYKALKALSTQEALKLLPSVEKKVTSVSGAIKAAVAGNVIDFATPNHFDLKSEFEKVFETDFAIDDELKFLTLVQGAKKIMIIGDNVGEHVFDKLLLTAMAKTYPNIQRYYAVRGRPIINDVTLVEAKALEMEAVAIVVDSGVPTPGLDYDHASEAFMRLYNTMDVIIAKGMGNYECLEGVKDKRIFHLFKVKCDVVAKDVGEKLGELIFMQNR